MLWRPGYQELRIAKKLGHLKHHEKVWILTMHYVAALCVCVCGCVVWLRCVAAYVAALESFGREALTRTWLEPSLFKVNHNAASNRKVVIGLEDL